MNALLKYRHTPKGVLTNLYHKMIERSKLKGISAPDFSLQEFHKMFLDNQIFLEIFKHWESRGYQYYDKPSIDRKNPDRGYTKDNIQVMSWCDNRMKGDKENSLRFTTPVIMYDLHGNRIKEFESIKEAVIYTGFNQGLITMCCQGKRNHTHGFKFMYRGDKFKKNKELLEVQP